MALGLTALANVSSSAHAAGSQSLYVGEPGAATTTWQGAALTGTSDPLGPPSTTGCDQSTCERTPVVVNAPAGFAAANDITLTASAVSSDGAGLDIAILDAAGDVLASQASGVADATTSVAYVAPGTYTVEVDGDTGDGGTYTGSASVSSAPITPEQTFPTADMSFGRETIADPIRTGTEPTIQTALDGTIYESPIFGFSTTLSFVDRSTDGGKTFHTLGVPTPAATTGKNTTCPGGGDSDLATDPNGNLYFIDLGGAPVVPAAVSSDRGNTFTSACLANDQSNVNNFPDRQWLSTDTVHGVEWYIYRDGLVSEDAGVTDSFLSKPYGEYIKYAPLAKAPNAAGAAQLAFTSLCTTSAVPAEATPCMSDVSIAGNAVTDDSATSPYAGTTYLAFTRGDGISVAAINPSGVLGDKFTVFKEFTAVPGAANVLFPTVAVDRSGTVYEAYTDAKTYAVMLTHSSDGGQTWSAPVQINAAPVHTTVMPWIVAGDGGRVDVVFYGSPKVDAPTTNTGPWNVYLVQSLDAASAAPHFTQNLVTDRPNHDEPICLSGLGCTTDTGPAGDRNLGDFFRVALDPSGRAVISFADGNNKLGADVPSGAANGGVANPSLAEFVQQASGPSLYSSVGTVPPVAVPTGSVTVAPHDVVVPVNAPAGVATPTPSLELLGSSVDYADATHLHVHLDVADLDTTAPATTTGGPVATYLTRWNSGGSIYYAAAELAGGQWSYFAGEAAPVEGGGNVKFVYYPATTAVTGSVTTGKQGTIDLTVPTSAVGGPKQGDELFSVTSYSLVHAAPTLPTAPTASEFTDQPTVADVLPAYNTAGPSGGAPPALPETHRPILLLAGLALLALAVAPGRRLIRRLAGR
ncbi:MAG TPA: hypothetical protein VFP61_05525 [Acidimicrobiales bacterium]|nr:hypothetical protein [Acidimicrobiales bacterium]